LEKSVLVNKKLKTHYYQ